MTMQIPMSEKDIKQALSSHANSLSVDISNLRSRLAHQVSIRYAAPDQSKVRQRFKIARIVQHGYIELQKLLCPGVDKFESCPEINKVLQLSQLYMSTYNWTQITSGIITENIQPMHISQLPDVELRAHEYYVMSAIIPKWAQDDILMSIMPQYDSIASELIAKKLTLRLEKSNPDDALTNLFVDDIEEHQQILLRVEHEDQLEKSINDFRNELSRDSALRTIGEADNIDVLMCPVIEPSLIDTVFKALVNRITELEPTNLQALGLIFAQLGKMLNEPKTKKWNNGTMEQWNL